MVNTDQILSGLCEELFDDVGRVQDMVQISI